MSEPTIRMNNKLVVLGSLLCRCEELFRVSAETAGPRGQVRPRGQQACGCSPRGYGCNRGQGKSALSKWNAVYFVCLHL